MRTIVSCNARLQKACSTVCGSPPLTAPTTATTASPARSSVMSAYPAYAAAAASTASGTYSDLSKEMRPMRDVPGLLLLGPLPARLLFPGNDDVEGLVAELLRVELGEEIVDGRRGGRRPQCRGRVVLA